MGCAIGIVKYLVFIFNLVFAIAGLALLIVGVLFKLSVEEYTQVIENQAGSYDFSIAPTLLIVVGAIVFIISFFGCCGAIKESTCMLITYAIILLVIFILQVAVGVYAFIQVKDNVDMEKELAKTLTEAFGNYTTSDTVKESIDLLQKNIKCCGVNGPLYWGLEVPTSCCENESSICTVINAYQEGCVKKLTDSIKDTIETIGYVAIGIAATEIIGAIFALCLTSSIRNQERRSPYA